MKQIYLYALLISGIVLSSCTKRVVGPADYVHYVEDTVNGLHIKQQMNGVTYVLQYQPVDYCVMLEKRSFTIPEEEFKEEYKRFNGLEHYVFKIDKTEMDKLVDKLGDSSKYKKGVSEYFDFGIQKDIKLIQGQDTIPCAICQRDAITGISPYYTFTLGFADASDKAADADKVIQFQNRILNTGKVMLCVKEKNIENIPGLKIM